MLELRVWNGAGNKDTALGLKKQKEEEERRDSRPEKKVRVGQLKCRIEREWMGEGKKSNLTGKLCHRGWQKQMRTMQLTDSTGKIYVCGRWNTIAQGQRCRSNLLPCANCTDGKSTVVNIPKLFDLNMAYIHCDDHVAYTSPRLKGNQTCKP